jgi:hypothetical protein
MRAFGFILNTLKNWFMSFSASNIVVGGSKIEMETPTPPTPTITDSTTLELTDKELELLLLTIKNGLFRGEYVETVYNLTLKLQKNLVDLKYKNNKL